MLAFVLFCIYMVVVSLMIRDSKHQQPQPTQFNKFYAEVKKIISEDVEDVWNNPETPSIEEVKATSPKKEKAPHSQFSIQQLRKMIREKGLHNRLGKPVNSCKKEELYNVIFAA
jgi:hypothetical protein